MIDLRRSSKAAMVSATLLQAVLASSLPGPDGAIYSGQQTTWEVPSYYPGSPWILPGPQTRTNICHVKAAENGNDSAPNIIAAFEACGKDGKIIFDDTIYHIESVMTTTGLSNVEIDIQGTLLWGTDIDYWLSHSLPVGYQNQSSAWVFGGDQIHLHGNGVGTLNGNGQVWYDFNAGRSNYPRRPHQITFSKVTRSVIENLRFVQSQMWTMTLINSENVLLQDIYVNSTDLSGRPARMPRAAFAKDVNTDGADTIYANNITFARWIVDCGDDQISCKANSTNILVEDAKFYRGSGMVLGSIGQYPKRYEIIENVTARNIEAWNSRQGVYIKTWTGVQKGFPPNGGGGGKGYAKNVTFNNFTLHNVPLTLVLEQCVSFEGRTGNCDTSQFQLSDLHMFDFTGEQRSNDVARIQCSAAAPCTGFNLKDIDMTVIETGEPATGYKCSNVVDPIGFECTGPISRGTWTTSRVNIKSSGRN